MWYSVELTLAKLKLKLMEVACPTCNMPFGSGGNLVTTLHPPSVTPATHNTHTHTQKTRSRDVSVRDTERYNYRLSSGMMMTKVAHLAPGSLQVFLQQSLGLVSDHVSLSQVVLPRSVELAHQLSHTRLPPLRVPRRTLAGGRGEVAPPHYAHYIRPRGSKPEQSYGRKSDHAVGALQLESQPRLQNYVTITHAHAVLLHQTLLD